MNCCGEEIKKEEKAKEHATHAAQGHSHVGCCGMGGGWMRWLWVGLLILLAASYFMK